MNNKKIEDATPDDFILHNADLDYFERTLSGMARRGVNVSNPDLYNATDLTVRKMRVERTNYFKLHNIKSAFEKSF